MERELEKTLMEIEGAIKSNERRGNTHTQSVLEQAREIVGMCVQAARTPSDLKEILERNTAQWPEETRDAFGDTRLICPHCRNSVINYFNRSRPPQFCMICGQRLRWEGEEEAPDWRESLLRKFDRRD